MKFKKPILWTLAAIPAVLLVIGFFVVHTEAFRHFLLGKIMEQAQTSTGTRLEISRMDLQWSPFTADFYGIVIHGQEQNAEPPLAKADQLRVSLGIRALLHKKVDLYAIILDHPVVHAHTDVNGHTNLPQPPSKQSSSNFDVLVRHLVITDGLLFYNDQQTPLSAELRDFRTQVNYDPNAGMYRGSLSYGRGRILAKDFNPIEHRAAMQFAANTQGMVLENLAIATEKSRFDLQAKIVDFSNPKVEGTYSGLISTPEFARILKNPSLPMGDITLKGVVAYQNAANQPPIRQIRLEGTLDSKTLGVRSTQAALALTSVRASYQLRDGNVRVQKLDADLLGGHLSAAAEMLHLDANTSSRVTAALRNVSLERISGAVPADARQNVVPKGRVKADLQASWGATIQNAKAHANIVISGPLSSAPQGNEVPVNANLTVDYDGAHQSVSFDHSQIRTAKTDIDLAGILSRNSKLDVNVNARDLHELSALASTIMAASQQPGSAPPTTYQVFGSARFAGQVSGAIQDPRIQGQLTAADLTVQGSKWRTIRAGIDASASGVHLQNAFAQTDHGGEITLNAQTGLQNWSFTPDSPLSARGKVNKVSLGELQLLAKTQYPVSGTLSGDFSIEGSERQPKGQGSLQLANASAWNEPIHTFVLQFQGTDETVVSTLQVRVAAGAANAKLTYFPKTQRYQTNLDAPDFQLDRLRALQQRKGSVNGVLSASVTGEGSLTDPQISAKVTARELQLSGQKFSDLDAKLDLAHQHADLQLTSGVVQSTIQVKAGVDLKADYPATATLDVRSLPLGPLMAMAQPAAAQDLRGETEIHGTLRGPLKDLSRVEARLEIPTLHVEYKTLQISNGGPIRANYRNAVATLEQLKIKGSGTQLSAQGTIPVKGTAPMNLSAKGTFDMALLQMVSPDLHSSGRIELDLRASGRANEPSTQGQVRIVNSSLAAESLPVALSSINGEINVSGNRVEIKEVKANAGGGTITTHGSLTYGKEPNFAVDVQAKSVRIHPNGLRSVLDGNVQLNGTPQKSMLSGQVLIDRLSFQDGFDMGTFLAQVSSDQQVSTPSPFENNLRLNVSIQSTQNLSVASSQLSMQGSTNLNVTGTAANPVILGRVNLTGGELFFLSKRFEVERGTIAFSNPVRTEPVLNLYVKTVVKQYNVTIHFAGPANELKTSYTSDPTLPELDIINLLAFGQTTAERASSPDTPPTLAAESAVAQQAAGQVASRLQQAAGLSQLTIDPLAGTSQDPGAQVAIQQRVTGSILVTFSTDVTSTQRQTVQIEYQPQKKWKYSFIRDEYGGYGIDVRYHKVF